jgi:formylglycine-generating enzyme required for sulfatase activity
VPQFWPRLERVGGRALAFEPGDLALCIESVAPRSAGAELGLEPGDCLVEVAGRPVSQGLVALAEHARADVSSLRVRRFDPVLRLGEIENPTEFERDLLFARASATPVVAEFASAQGPARIALEKRDREFSPALGSLVEALAADLPEDGLELVALQRGELRALRVASVRPLGLALSLTANPLVCAPTNRIGTLPDCAAELEPGSYLLLARAAGFQDLRIPLLVADSKPRVVRVELVPLALGLPGFVNVAAGECLIGEESPAEDVRRRELLWQESFWIARQELTLGEYMEFLQAEQTAAAIRVGELNGTHLRVPRRPLIRLPWNTPCEVLPGWDTHGGPFECEQDPALPIWGLTCEDMDAYCAWRTQHSPQGRAGWYFRLPTEDEWEKAARGVDGRLYPWGDGVEPGFCRCREARLALDPEAAVMEPGLRFPIDESPFGVRDTAGGRFEMCVGGLSGPFRRPWRGGHQRLSLTLEQTQLHSAYHYHGNPTTPGQDDGFRIVAWRRER